MPNIVWSEFEKNFVLNNAGRLTDKQMAEELTKISGRKVTLAAARKQRQKLGVKKVCGRGRCKLAGENQDGLCTTTHTINRRAD